MQTGRRGFLATVLALAGAAAVVPKVEAKAPSHAGHIGCPVGISAQTHDDGITVGYCDGTVKQIGVTAGGSGYTTAPAEVWCANHLDPATGAGHWDQTATPLTAPSNTLHFQTSAGRELAHITDDNALIYADGTSAGDRLYVDGLLAQYGYRPKAADELATVKVNHQEPPFGPNVPLRVQFLDSGVHEVVEYKPGVGFVRHTAT